MRTLMFVGLAISAALIHPALADSMSKMKSGQVIAVMPDGHMGNMMATDQKMIDMTLQMAKPIDHCVMMMTGPDGKMYMVDTTPEEQKECEKMAK